MHVSFASIELLESRRLLSAGGLDPSFGVGGKIVGDFGSSSSASVAMPYNDGNDFVIAGPTKGAIENGSVVLRYDYNYIAENTFGSNGQAFIPDFDVAAAAQQISGRILLAGTTNSPNQTTTDFMVVALTADGKIDPAFGNGGIAIIDAGHSERATTIIVRRDGRIVIGGISAASEGAPAGTLTFARLNADGMPDRAFGLNGIATIDTGALPAIPAAISFTRDGRIVVAGTSYQSFGAAGLSAGLLLRLRADGSLDSEFGVGGIVHVDDAIGTTHGYGVLQVDRGNIVTVAGQQNGAVIVERFDAAGQLDPHFGQGGYGAISFGRNKTVRIAASIFGIDFIGVTVGPFKPSHRTAFYQPGAVRFNDDGSPDLSFGDHGKSLVHWGPGLHDARASAYVGDGIILAGGERGSMEISALDPANGKLVQYRGDGGKIVVDVNPGVGMGIDSTMSLGVGQTLALAKFGISFRQKAIVATDGSSLFNGGKPLFLNLLYNSASLLVGDPTGSRFAVVGLTDFGTADQSDVRKIVLMFNSDGTPVTAFGNNGSWLIPADSPMSWASAGIFQKGRLILAGGDGAGAFLFTRLQAEGGVDQTFGENGYVRVEFRVPPPPEFITNVITSVRTLVIQDDGKIIAAGTDGVYSMPETPNGLVDLSFAAARLSPDGIVDAGFGRQGRFTVRFDDPSEVSFLNILPDGRILLGGDTFFGAWDFQSSTVLARLKPDGTLDPSFANAGTMELRGNELTARLAGMSVQPDGKTLLARTVTPNSEAFSSAELLRLLQDGSIDTQFGTVGRTLVNDAIGSNLASIHITADGSIMGIGSSENGIVLYRFLNDVPLIHAEIVDRTLVITGSAGDDRIILLGDPETGYRIDGLDQHFSFADFSAVRVSGLGGRDYIDLSTFSRESGLMFGPVFYPATIDGGAGDDTIVSGPGDDFIFGGRGDDSIFARAGDDTVFGHFGDDTLHGDDGNDYLNGGPGIDQVFGDAGNDQILATDGEADTLSGGQGFDRADGDVFDELTEIEASLT